MIHTAMMFLPAVKATRFYLAIIGREAETHTIIFSLVFEIEMLMPLLAMFNATVIWHGVPFNRIQTHLNFWYVLDWV